MNQIRKITMIIGAWTNAPVNLLTVLTITAAEFPKFFSKYELAPPN
jgi:hypothetical protein